MTTKIHMQPPQTSEAQRIARLMAIHRRLLTAAARLTQNMKRVDGRVYEAAAADVLAVKSAVESSTRLFTGRERIS